jgi:hypothetical protein
VRDPGLRDLLLEQLAPVRVPTGRWPAPAGRPLATSQQLAINADPNCGGQPGQVSLGFGWGIGGGGQVVAVFGRSDSFRGTVIASENDDGYFENWSIGVTVRCANL